jgi:hypothetical protein
MFHNKFCTESSLIETVDPAAIVEHHRIQRNCNQHNGYSMQRIVQRWLQSPDPLTKSSHTQADRGNCKDCTERKAMEDLKKKFLSQQNF